ncbi:DUF3426 domain-containing protein [Lysobacter sp. Root690]|uniref:DUF3426 domain-containing protein n=1 Tax=Lysobacter sp. Root690 TaxID=1736588 RepID=UPI0006F8E7D5|nr:DUF3426 domain-containing protein [Lysobacter sp. Root690]KRB03444.1 hypothetical protein ASD86_21495 [Lysobacter sp. Root690]
MFVACPHCGYLVALVVAQDGPTRTCPRCAGALQSQGVANSGDTAASAVQAPNEQAPNEDANAVAPESKPVAATNVAAADIDDIASVLRKKPHKGPTEIPASPAESTSAVDVAATVEVVNQAADSVADASDAAPNTDIAADDIPPAQPATPAAASQSADAALTPLSAAVPIARKRPAKRAGKSETAVTSARRAPSFARQHARANAAPTRLHWSGPLLIGVLTIALALQLLLAQRDELAADARWRPLLASLCGVLACEIPPWHEPAALTMLNRNVLPVADRAGVLRVNASFRNDARWAQPWPTLVLSLEDVDGRRVGQRAFSPQDYRKGYRADERIAPGQSAAVQFDVLEPAPHVVAFTFDFR